MLINRLTYFPNDLFRVSSIALIFMFRLTYFPNYLFWVSSIALIFMFMYEGHLQRTWTLFISPSLNIVEVRWRPLFRSTSLGKRCTSYTAPRTSRKRAADRWSLRNFLPRSSLVMVGKAEKSMGRDLNWILCSAWKKWIGGTPLEHPPYSPNLVPCNFGAFPTMKRELRDKKFRSDQRSAVRFREVGGAL
jgi:hypothetical protein